MTCINQETLTFADQVTVVKTSSAQRPKPPARLKRTSTKRSFLFISSISFRSLHLFAPFIKNKDLVKTLMCRPTSCQPVVIRLKAGATDANGLHLRNKILYGIKGRSTSLGHLKEVLRSCQIGHAIRIHEQNVQIRTSKRRTGVAWYLKHLL